MLSRCILTWKYCIKFIRAFLRQYLIELMKRTWVRSFLFSLFLVAILFHLVVSLRAFTWLIIQLLRSRAKLTAAKCAGRDIRQLAITIKSNYDRRRDHEDHRHWPTIEWQIAPMILRDASSAIAINATMIKRALSPHIEKQWGSMKKCLDLNRLSFDEIEKMSIEEFADDQRVRCNMDFSFSFDFFWLFV